MSKRIIAKSNDQASVCQSGCADNNSSPRSSELISHADVCEAILEYCLKLENRAEGVQNRLQEVLRER